MGARHPLPGHALRGPARHRTRRPGTASPATPPAGRPASARAAADRPDRTASRKPKSPSRHRKPHPKRKPEPKPKPTPNRENRTAPGEPEKTEFLPLNSAKTSQHKICVDKRTVNHCPASPRKPARLPSVDYGPLHRPLSRPFHGRPPGLLMQVHLHVNPEHSRGGPSRRATRRAPRGRRRSRRYGSRTAAAGRPGRAPRPRPGTRRPRWWRACGPARRWPPAG
jgi:hypothetical protein